MGPRPWSSSAAVAAVDPVAAEFMLAEPSYCSWAWDDGCRLLVLVWTALLPPPLLARLSLPDEEGGAKGRWFMGRA